MSDRPIIFSAPMVRALLDGRKTMTRRILRPQPDSFRLADGTLAPVGLTHIEGDPWPRVTIGRVITRQEVRYRLGMLLWVRENLGVGYWPRRLWWAAGERPVPLALGEFDFDRHYPRISIPSIHMPRWASRLTLRVTGVKIERLQDISEEEDAAAEGFNPPFVILRDEFDGVEKEWPVAAHSRGCFAKFWQKLHGQDSWRANPWVVAITFDVINANIDAVKRQQKGAAA